MEKTSKKITMAKASGGTRAAYVKPRISVRKMTTTQRIKAYEEAHPTYGKFPTLGSFRGGPYANYLEYGDQKSHVNVEVNRDRYRITSFGMGGLSASGNVFPPKMVNQKREVIKILKRWLVGIK